MEHEKNIKQRLKTIMGMLDTAGGTLKRRVLLGCLVFAVLTLAGICLGIISLYFSAGLYSKELLNYYLQQPKLVWLNTLPYLMVMYLVWFLTNRPWVGFGISGLVTVVYSLAEYWKLLSRNDPVYAEDLALLKEAVQMSGEYIAVTPVMILAVGLIFLGTVVLFLAFRKTKVFTPVPRVVLGLSVLLVSGGLYRTVYTSTQVYGSFQVWEPLNQWFDNNKYISRGGIYPFIYSIQSALPQEPEGYDAQEAEELLKQYPSDDIPEELQANVICIMLEAFSDLSEETDLITEGDPYEAYHQLKEESYSGKLMTNIFAGGTINTERCVVTGFSELGSFRRSSWSYAHYFQSQGYSVTGSHGGYQDFYNRANVNRNLGFEDYYFLENHYYKFGDGVTMDYNFLPEVTELCKTQMEAGEKVFSFNVTYQNHGPYDTTLWRQYVPYVKEGAVGDADYGIINNYLNGVADTGNRLLEMADAFRDNEEPVILVIFGDHKPWLGDSSTTYAALGIDIQSGSEESVYNHYTTDYLIWGNDAAREIYGDVFSGEGPTISPCYLMNVLFERCGWAGPSYLKLTNEVMDALPIQTTTGYFRERDALISETELSEQGTSLLNKMRNVQYYLTWDSGGELPNP